MILYHFSRLSSILNILKSGAYGLSDCNALKWTEMLVTGQAANLSDLAKKLWLVAPYVTRILGLANLAPDIVEAVCSGCEPEGVYLARLVRDFVFLSYWCKNTTEIAFYPFTLHVECDIINGMPGQRLKGKIMSGKILNAAVIGLERIAWRCHLPLLQQKRNYRLTAVCDPVTERTAKVARIFGIQATYNSLRVPLENQRPDLIAIALPTCHHAKQAILSMGTLEESC